MALSHLTCAGIQLQNPSSSVDELFMKLDLLEHLLTTVEQSPSESMKKALSFSMEALIANDLLRHKDIDVNVSVASCISEIIRITAPDAPYEDDQMKEVFQLIVSSFEKLDDKFSPSYGQRISILETMAEVRSCLVMLDLECDALIAEMFHHFFRTIRSEHPVNVFLSMETIMTLVLEESQDISTDLCSCILDVLKTENKEVRPFARLLGEKVVDKCASKLKPYMLPVIKSRGTTVDNYSKVVAKVFQAKIDTNEPSEAEAKKASTEKKVSSEKKVPFEKKAAKCGKELVGLKVQVWWPDDKKHCNGVIEHFDPASGKHKVLYSDGDVQVLKLEKEKWKLINDDSMPDEGDSSDGESPDEAAETPKAKASPATAAKQGKTDTSAKKSGASTSKSKTTTKSRTKLKDDCKVDGIETEETLKSIAKSEEVKGGKTKNLKSGNKTRPLKQLGNPKLMRWVHRKEVISLSKILLKVLRSPRVPKSGGSKSNTIRSSKVKDAAPAAEDEDTEYMVSSPEPPKVPEISKGKSVNTSKSKSAKKRKRGTKG